MAERHRLPGLLVLWLIAVVAVAGCSSNETVKRRFVASGDAYAAEAKYKEAILEYRLAVQKDERFAEARLKLARAYDQTGNVVSAVREYVRAADLLPDDDDAQLNAGRHLLMVRRFDDARARAATILERSPANISAKILMGNARAGLNDLNAAVRRMEETVLNGSALTAPLNIEFLRLPQNRKDEAEQIFTQAIAADTESLPARLALANFYLADARLGDAEHTLKEALLINPRDPLTNRALAVLYIASGSPDAQEYVAAAAETSRDSLSKLMQAAYYSQSNRDNEAARILIPLTKSDATFAEATTRLAEIDERDGYPDRADARLAGVFARDARNPRALTLRGRLRFDHGNLAGATGDLETARTLAPSSLAPRFLLAAVYERANDPGAALKEYEGILKIAPASTRAQYALSRLHLADGNASLAVQYASQALAGAPADVDVRLLWARALGASGDVDRAVAELQTLAEQEPGNADVRAACGALMLGQARWAEAEKWFRAALAVDATHGEAAIGLVNVAIMTKHFAEARARLDARLASMPDDRHLDLVAAEAYVRAGAASQAEALLLKTIQAEPARLAAYVLLGRLYISQKRLADAQKQFETVLAKAPASVGAATMLGVILEDERKPSDAQRMYERALEIDPTAPVAANNLAWIYSNNGADLDVALQLARRAKQQLSNDPSVDDTLGWVYYRKELAAPAIDSFERAVKGAPGDAGFLFHLGLAYAKAGRPQPAASALRRALSLNPTFDGAVEARRLLARDLTPRLP